MSNEVMTKKELNEGTVLKLDFEKLRKIGLGATDVLVVVVQNAITKEVLITAYANEDALTETLVTGKAVFWSTSRNERWCKGESSGDWLEIVDVFVNCEMNSLLYLVNPRGKGGNACHTNRISCYYRSITKDRALRIVK